MSDKGLTVSLLLKATDGMSDVIKKACTQSDNAFSEMNERLNETADKFNNFGQKTVIAGAALTGLSALNVKAAADFERGMNNVKSTIDSSESIKEISDEVLEIGKNSPKALSDLAEGLFDIRSAGISASDQFRVLKGSEMLSVTGLSTVAEATDIATSAINAFGLSGEKGAKIYDNLFKGIQVGKMSASEFAQGFGAVAGVVAASKIQFDEYVAAVSAMTTQGMKANIAHTQLKAAITSLTRGSKEQIQVFSKYGVKSFDALIQKTGGMVPAFEAVYKAVGGDKTQLIQVLGSVEALNGVLSLMGGARSTYIAAIQDMRFGDDLLNEKYLEQTEGLSSQMQVMTNNVSALSVRFGNALLPIVKAAANGIRALTGFIDKMPDSLINFVSIATLGLGAFLTVVGGSSIAVGSMVKNLIFLRETVRGLSIVGWATGISFGWLTAVTIGIAALAAGAVYCYNRFEGFRNICRGLWATLQAGGAWIAVLCHKTAELAKNVFEFIKPALKVAGIILSWMNPLRGAVELFQALIRAMGGAKNIGNKLQEWAGNSKAAADEINNGYKNNKKADGSHLTGLNYVPYDGYIAETHKGEAILTADEAESWRSKKHGQTPVTINYSPNLTFQGGSNENIFEFKKILNEHKEQIYNMVLDCMRRREIRAY